MCVLWSKVLSLYFCMISSCTSTTCWKDYPFPIELKIIDHKYKESSLILNSQFCSNDLSLCQYYTNLIICIFIVSFEIRKWKSSRFVLFQSSFGYSVLFCFVLFFISIRIFGSACEFLQRKPAEISIEIELNLYINLGRITI